MGISLCRWSFHLKDVFVTVSFLICSASAQTPVVPASVGSPSSHQPIQLSDLQSILATMNVPASAAQGSAGESAPAPERWRRKEYNRDDKCHWTWLVWCCSVDLASVCTPEMMAPILTNAEVQQRLLPFLPSGESLPQSAEEIQNTINSPQFQQVTRVLKLGSKSLYLVFSLCTIIPLSPQIILFIFRNLMMLQVLKKIRFVMFGHKKLFF